MKDPALEKSYLSFLHQFQKQRQAWLKTLRPGDVVMYGTFPAQVQDCTEQGIYLRLRNGAALQIPFSFNEVRPPSLEDLAPYRPRPTANPADPYAAAYEQSRRQTTP